jgi:hypothetical protein
MELADDSFLGSSASLVMVGWCFNLTISLKVNISVRKVCKLRHRHFNASYSQGLVKLGASPLDLKHGTWVLHDRDSVTRNIFSCDLTSTQTKSHPRFCTPRSHEKRNK